VTAPHPVYRILAAILSGLALIAMFEFSRPGSLDIRSHADYVAHELFHIR
jgi:hypothetical protein